MPETTSLDSDSPPPERVEAVWRDLQGVNRRVNIIQSDVQELRGEVAHLSLEMRNSLKTLTDNVNNLTSGIVELSSHQIRAAEQRVRAAERDAEHTQQIGTLRLSVMEHAKTAGIAGAAGTVAGIVAQYGPALLAAFG